MTKQPQLTREQFLALTKPEQLNAAPGIDDPSRAQSYI